jgi:Rps23 Pro-64 3,4-dihydroxylase Tpa1-like proline 4-hydroxylase
MEIGRQQRLEEQGFLLCDLKELISEPLYREIKEITPKIKEKEQSKENMHFRGDYFITNKDGRVVPRGFTHPWNEIPEKLNDNKIDWSQKFWEYTRPSVEIKHKFDEISFNIINQCYTSEKYTDWFDIFKSRGLFTLFEEGNLIKEHRDGRNPGRICALMIYLNENWKENDGGELVLIDKQGEKQIITPKYGNIVILDFTKEDNNLSHEVLRVNGEFKRWTYLHFVTLK